MTAKYEERLKESIENGNMAGVAAIAVDKRGLRRTTHLQS
jgi:hypothetical protein